MSRGHFRKIKGLVPCLPILDGRVPYRQPFDEDKEYSFIEFQETLAPGQTFSSMVFPQELFRPSRLVFAPHNARHVLVNDVKIGKNSFFATSCPIPASCLPPIPPHLATEKQWIERSSFQLDTCQVSQRICIYVESVHPTTQINFNATMWGKAIYYDSEPRSETEEDEKTLKPNETLLPNGEIEDRVNEKRKAVRIENVLCGFTTNADYKNLIVIQPQVPFKVRDIVFAPEIAQHVKVLGARIGHNRFRYDKPVPGTTFSPFPPNGAVDEWLKVQDFWKRLGTVQISQALIIEIELDTERGTDKMYDIRGMIRGQTYL